MLPAARSQSSGPIYSAFQDEADFRELLEDFFQSAQERQSLLRESFASGQLGTVRVHAHQLKGASGGYGFEALSGLASELEEACKKPQPNLDEIGPLLDDVVDYLSRIRV